MLEQHYLDDLEALDCWKNWIKGLISDLQSSK